MHDNSELQIILQNDGGAFCEGYLPRAKGAKNITISFCYLDFCLCNEGCI